MNNYKEVNGITIYSLDYLANEELSDNDLSNLFDNGNKGLLYSIILNMFKFVGIKKSNKDIIKIITTKKKWMNDYIWNTNELKKFEELLTKVLKNIYYWDDNISKQNAQWYIIIYGFRIKDSNIDL